MLISRKNIILVATYLLCSQMTACNSWENIRSADEHVSDIERQGGRDIKNQTKDDVVSDIPSQWVNLTPISNNIEEDEEHDIPDCNVIINHPSSVSINYLISFLSEQCNIPISLTHDAMNAMAADKKAPSSQDYNPSAAEGDLPTPNDDNKDYLQEKNSDHLDGITWNGNLNDLLNNITGRLGLGWRYLQNRIEIYYLDTRHFPILFMDSKASFYSKILSGTTSSNDSSGSNSNIASNDNNQDGSKNDGNTNQSTTMEIKSSLYDDVSKSVKMMLTPEVGRMNLSAGMLTVMDTPSVLAKVNRYINDRNKELNRQVMLNVQVYSVEKQQKDQLGIDWNAVFKDSLGFSFTNAYTEASAAMMSGGVSILDGKSKGSSAFIKALAQQVNVSMLTQASSMTTNLSAVPIQVALQQDYASNASTENTANVGSSSSISKSTITTGFNMTVLPYLIPNSSRMQIQFSINMSDEPTIRTFKSENTSVELMKTRLKTFNQRVIMSSGQTLVLSGYQSLNNTADHQGVGSSHFFALGGGAEGDENKSMLVILITPVESN
ncbi:PilN family type IVB pilus formation outer membrane protein [Rosenbergiella nectarea]|uniref:PilN family type IVB pilus formation outer membrane protein n=1 Tax=Rosenbergiella nectarea TaxID=988801 RepID=UPI001F4ECB90|nr:PilN family type IVB pilus formation outer membrane protein [Rosenbergiella nectarea]